MQCDLLLRGGRVLDPSQGWDGIADVALAGGRIVALGPDLPTDSAARVEDVSGRLVTPGLIDLHAHVFPGITDLGLDADATSLAKGVTTVLDAGSAGATNIVGFRHFVVEPARTRIRALLNISLVGMPFAGAMTELGWVPLLDADAAVAAVQAHRDLIVGLKVRVTRYLTLDNGAQPLYVALEAGRRAGCPLMVHIGDSPIPLGEILDALRPGDIVTHTYTAFAGTEPTPDGKGTRRKPDSVRGGGISILDAEGRVIPPAWEARRRGVIFDVGHGMGSFSFAVCREAMGQGFKPDTIGSDLHTANVRGPVFDLPTLMSRFLSLGMTLPEVIGACSSRPAQILGLAGEIGTLRPGAAGDVTVLELQQGRFDYRDSVGTVFWGEQKLLPRLTVRAGEIVARDGQLVSA
jgi:dihydroorotase